LLIQENNLQLLAFFWTFQSILIKFLNLCINAKAVGIVVRCRLWLCRRMCYCDTTHESHVTYCSVQHIYSTYCTVIFCKHFLPTKGSLAFFLACFNFQFLGVFRENMYSFIPINTHRDRYTERNSKGSPLMTSYVLWAVPYTTETVPLAEAWGDIFRIENPSVWQIPMFSQVFPLRKIGRLCAKCL
jgi:hypothetical protein